MRGISTRILYILLIVIAAHNVLAQIDVHINSGDPRIPFPQFLDYSHGKTLGRDNAIGVTDIEMERDIREAYQIMMNRAVYTGDEVAGTRYIVFNPEDHGFTGPEPDVTEGDGYALLAMAYMADKPAYDGLFMYVHDHKRSQVELFGDCGTIRNPDYEYGPGTVGWKPGEDDAAADGDFDIAMAALVAYYQWPEQGITDDCGNVRLYKDLAIDMLRTISDTVFFDVGNGTTDRDLVNCNPGSDGWYSGDIGFDGYVKSGNTWAEVTRFGQGYQWNGNTFCPRSEGEASKHIDYHAPSYFHSFSNFLVDEDSAQYAWNIHQFKRAEASSDWLMGQVNQMGLYPTAGNFMLNGGTPMFSEMNPAEDSRHPWRTIVNYTWHGNPETSWNPNTHEVEDGGNTFEYDNAMTMAQFAKDLSTDICIKLGNDPTELQFGGVAALGQDINHSSGMMQTGVGFHINWNLGSIAPSIVSNHYVEDSEESKQLLAEWYRQLVLMWDATNEGQPYPESRYITSLPKYFHGWFRLLGLLVTSGNYQSPEFMSSDLPANVKVYHETDRTVAYGPSFANGRQLSRGDVVTAKFSYRNYSTTDASNVQIVYPLPEAVEFVSATNGGMFDGTNVTWNIGDIPGYTSTGETGDDWENFDPTTYQTYGEVTLQYRIKAGYENTMICNQATLTADNSAPHTSNEYPNNYTTTLERNCIDILERSLIISKRADKTVLKDGDIVEFGIDFKNNANSGWLNGGRPGIRVTYAYGMPGAYSYTNYFRLLHGAQEAYINPKNYRVSYYLNDPARIGIYNDPDNVRGWDVQDMIQGEGGPMTFDSEEYTFGEDEFGKWNQRLIMRFPDTLMSTTQHTNMFFAKDGEPNDVLFVHKGIGSPFRKAIKMEAKGAPGSGCGTIPFDDLLTDDWSFPGSDYDVGTNDKSMYFPISPSWYDFESTYDESLSEPITDFHPDACQPQVTNTYDRVMVEEFDGYIWRRILGNGPVPGIELDNVCVYDTLPADLVWQGFTDSEALNVNAEYDPTTRVISWCSSTMLPGASGNLTYRAMASTDCASNKLVKNSAWIQSSSSSPIDSTVELVITCEDIPPSLNLGSTMYKFADRDSTDVGETIKYDVAFKQTDGTIATADLSTTDHWETECGNSMLDFTDSRNGNNNPTLVTYDYSHGTNGTLWAKVAPSVSGGFSLVFRHQRGSGSPTCGGYEGLVLGFSTNQCAQAQVSLYQDGTEIGSLSNLSYAAPADTMTIKVELEGDKLSFWINNENALPYVFDGIDLPASGVDPGYVGFYSSTAEGGSNESQSLVGWKTHFDSGFEVELKDLLPGEVTIDENSITVLENTKGSGGSYTSVPTYDGSGEIIWTLVEDIEPMLFGDSVVFTFDADVDDCGIGSITNVVTANMLGQPEYFIGDDVTTPCGAPEPCPLQEITISPSPTLVVEEGGSGVLSSTLTSDDAGIGYKYTWTQDGISHVGMSGQDMETLNVEGINDPFGTGSYKLRVEDLLDPTCFVESEITVVSIGEVTCSITGETVAIDESDVTVTGLDTLLTTSTSATTSGLTYSWYTDYGTADQALVEEGIGLDTLEVTTDGEYTVVVSESGIANCEIISDPVSVEFEEPPLCYEPNPLQIFKDGVEIPIVNNSLSIEVCEGEDTRLVIAPQDYDYEYDIRGIIFGIPAAPAILDGQTYVAGDSIPFTIDDTERSYAINVYYDPPGNGNEQECPLDQVTLTVNTNPNPVIEIVSDTGYCSTDSLDIEVTAIANATYTWSTTEEDFDDTDNILEDALLGNYTVGVDLNGCTSSIQFEVVEEQLETAQIISNEDTLYTCLDQIGLEAEELDSASGQWSISPASTSSSATFAPDDEFETVMSNLEINETYEVVWAVSSDYCPIQYDTVYVGRIDAIPNAVVTISADDTICSGSDYVVRAMNMVGGNANYSWSVNGGLPVNGVDSLVLNNVSVNTTVEVIMETDLTCITGDKTANEIMELVVDEPVDGLANILNPSTDELITCLNEVDLEAEVSATGTGSWNISDGTVNNQNTNTTIANLDPSVDTTYINWILNSTYRKCPSDTDVVSIIKNGLVTSPEPQAIDDTVCVDVTGTLLTAATPAANEVLSWSSLTGGSTIDAASGVVSQLVEGENVFVATIDFNGECSASDTVMIYATPQPQKGGITPIGEVCTSSVDLYASLPVGMQAGEWSSTNSNLTFDDVSSPTTTVSGLTNGANEISWMVDAGACGTIDSTITIIKSGELDNAFAGINSQLCLGEGIYQALANEPNNANNETGVWTIVSGEDNLSIPAGEETNHEGQFTLLDTGSVQLEWMISNGTCPESRDTITITILEKPLLNGTLTYDQQVCFGVEYLFEYSNPIDGEIYNFDSPDINLPINYLTADQSQAMLSFTESTNDSATVFMRATNFCGDTSLFVRIDLIDLPLEPVLGGEQLPCVGDPKTYSITNTDVANYEYDWYQIYNDDTTLISTAKDEVTLDITFSTGGEYTLMVVATDPICGNSVEDFITITVISSGDPSVELSSDDILFCEDEPILINSTIENAGLTPSIQWYVNNEEQTANEDEESFSIANLDPGNYSVRVVLTSNASCNSGQQDEDLLNFEVAAQPEPYITDVDTTICVGNSITLLGTGSFIASELQWVKIGDGDIDASTMNNPTTSLELSTLSDAGFYILAETTTECGTIYSEDTASIVVSNDLEVAIKRNDEVYTGGEQIYILDDETVGLEGIGINGSFENPFWTDHTTDTTLGALYSAQSILENYTLVFNASSGACSDSVSIIVSQILDISVPEVFSPNGDGLFDTWEITGTEKYDDLLIEVFNRWGQKIYQNQGAYDPWDGTYNNKGVPNAVYYYVITPGDGEEILTGNVTVQR